MKKNVLFTNLEELSRYLKSMNDGASDQATVGAEPNKIEKKQ